MPPAPTSRRPRPGKTDHRAVAELARTEVQQAPRRGGGASVDELCGLYAGLLGRDVVTPDDSFVGLGADSLSYVELSVRLGERLERLPRDWHLRTIAELASGAGRPSRRGTSTDPSVILRAVAIVLIVGTHANLMTIVGGAHVLLAVAGYNAARFLPRHARAARRLARSAWRIALPSCLWIGAPRRPHLGLRAGHCVHGQRILRLELLDARLAVLVPRGDRLDVARSCGRARHRPPFADSSNEPRSPGPWRWSPSRPSSASPWSASRPGRPSATPERSSCGASPWAGRPPAHRQRASGGSSRSSRSR